MAPGQSSSRVNVTLLSTRTISKDVEPAAAPHPIAGPRSISTSYPLASEMVAVAAAAAGHALSSSLGPGTCVMRKVCGVPGARFSSKYCAHSIHDS